MKTSRTSKNLIGFLSLILVLGIIALMGLVVFRQPGPQVATLATSQTQTPRGATPPATPALAQAIITPQATSPGSRPSEPTAIQTQPPIQPPIQPPVATISSGPGATATTQPTALPQGTTQLQIAPQPPPPAPSGTAAALAEVGTAVAPVPPPLPVTPEGSTSPEQPPVPTAVAPGSNPPENPVHTVPGTGAAEPTPVLTPAALLPSEQSAGSNAGGHAGGDASINTPRPAPKLPQAPPAPTVVTVKATPKPKPGQIVLPNGVIYGEHKPNLPNRIVRITSPNIKLDTSVYEVYSPKGTWEVADYAAGHNYNSKNPGEGGNIVLAGHNNWRGEVFRYLVDLKPGNVIKIWTLEGKELHYTVQSINKVLETGASYAQRLQNAKVMDPTASEQLTLITCWPYTTFTHRVIVVAKPSP